MNLHDLCWDVRLAWGAVLRGKALSAAGRLRSVAAVVRRVAAAAHARAAELMRVPPPLAGRRSCWPGRNREAGRVGYYDVAPDGRFLMTKSVAPNPDSQTHVSLVLNWLAKLQSRRP
jgi:hypothetical protein